MTDNTEEQTPEAAEASDIINASGDSLTIAAPTNIPALGQASGDWDTDGDISFPKLQIAQGVGPLSDAFPKGSIVLDQELELCKMGSKESPAQSVEITVLYINKSFEENVPYGSGELPRIARTKEEVLRLDGTTSWSTDKDTGERIPPTFKACADALICIKQPEHLADEKGEEWFPYEFGDHKYTFAQWKIKGVAYNRAAVPINTAAKMYYRNGLDKGSFLLSSEKEVFNGNTVACPRIVRGSKNDPEFSAWLAEFVG